MSTTLVVCPECSSPVAPGRLTCASCGTLLASVVGADRRLAVAVAPPALPEIDEDRPLAAFRAPDPAPEPVRAAEPPPPKRGPRRLTRSKPAAEPAKDRYVAEVEPVGQIPEQTSIFGAAPTVAPPIVDEWPNASFDATPSSGSGGSSPEAAPVPGAYLAPSASYVAPLAPRPVAAAAPPSPPPLAPAPFSSAVASWAVQQGSASPAIGHGAIAPQRTGAAQNDDTARSLSDWLVVGGATLAIVSFILPWATDGVLGSNGIGYTAQWGLANGGHLILIAAAALVLLLHLGSSPVPSWFRSSVAPLAVGGLLAGLAFAYYARPFGGGAGVAVLLAGAVLLLVGGLLASRPQRNARGASTV
ncbi:MAG: hypothetical protein ABI628_05125 [Chloroflexota bacterium]